MDGVKIPESANGNGSAMAKLVHGRKMITKGPVRGFAKYVVRKWIPDPKGPLIGVDGVRGRYAEPQVIANKKFNYDFTKMSPEQKRFFENLLTNNGRDEIHVDMYTTTSKSGSGFNYIGLTVNAAAPDATDTALAGEITAGGLARIQATTRTHTTGTNTSTIQHTFTATATHTDVQKSGLFDDAGPPVNGVMGHENTFTPVTLQTNDQLQVTWLITAG